MTTKKTKKPRHTPETNPKFWAIIDERRAQGELNERIVLDIVKSTDQPLSANEITLAYLKTKKLKSVNPESYGTYIRKLIANLEAAGKISSRVETLEERKIRANGNQPRGFAATLYFISSNKQARRTKYEALTGIALKSEGYTGKQIGTYPKKAARKAAKKQTDSAYVEQLEARVRELEAKMTAINVLSS